MKRIFKKLLSTALVATMFLCSLPLAGFVGLELSDISALFELKAMATDTTYTEGYYTYTVDENGNAKITDVDTSISGDVTIPSSFGDFIVTGIGRDAFYGCSSITNITIPEGLVKIDKYAFDCCYNLKSITIPDSVEYIGDYVFNSCDGLESINVSTSNNSYSSDEFGVLFNKTKNELIHYPAGSLIYCYTIPYGVTKINMYAFENSSNLTDIIIPDSVTTIEDYSFDGCSLLTNITISDNIQKICLGAFNRTKIFLEEKNWENGVLYIDNCLVSAVSQELPSKLAIKEGTRIIANQVFYNSNELTEVTIPGSVKYIGDKAFYGCESLVKVSLENGVTSIGNEAFRECKNLAEISISNSVTNIGEYTFAYCESLTSVELKGVTTIPKGAFYVCGNLNELSLGESVSTIGEGAFLGTGVTSVELPDSIITIESGAFYASALTSISISANVSNIGEMAFAYCADLKNISIPDSITSISYGMFGECTNLTSVTIPASITEIDSYAFSGCSSLTDVYYIGTEEEWNAITIGEENEPLLNTTIHFVEPPVHNHSYSSTVTKEARCTETGIMTYTCECGDNYTEEIAITSHSDGDWEILTDSTCTTLGKKIKKCIVCGKITRSETIPFASHPDGNSDGLCDVCDKISNENMVKGIYISIATPETRTINYMESIKLYATATNLPEGYKIKWKVEGEGVSIKPSTNGKTCTVTSTSTGNVVIKAYVVNSNGNIVTGENGKQICDSEYFYSEANLWLRIVYFFKKLFGISMNAVQAYKGII